MKIITVANTKGGAGKTTVAINLAVAALSDNKKVLLIDADSKQGSSLAFCAIRKQSDKKNLNCIAISTPTIHEDIEKHTKEYDFIVIDVGGVDSGIMRSAVIASNDGALIIPTQPSVLDMWALENTLIILKEARKIAPLKNVYSLFNQVLPNNRIKVTQEAKEVMDELIQDYQIGFLKSFLCSRVSYKNSIALGLGIKEFTPLDNKACDEVTKLYKEITKIFTTKK